MGKAVKKVVKVVAPIAIGFIAGPAVGAALGVGTAAGTGIVAGATSGLMGGGGLEGALKGAALGGFGGWALGKFAGAAGAEAGAAGAGGLTPPMASPLTSMPTTPLSGLDAITNPAGALASPTLSSAGFATTAGAGTLGSLTGAEFGATAGEVAAGAPDQGFLGKVTDKVNQTMGTNLSKGDLLKTGLNVAKNLYQSSQQEQLAEEMARMADPNASQRTSAVNMGLKALNDPTNLPYYDQLIRDRERMLKRQAAASGQYYNPRTLEALSNVPAETAMALQRNQITNAGTVAGSTGGSPSTAAQLYGNSRTAASAYNSDLFNTLAGLYGN